MPKIMVIDDDANIRAVLKLRLERSAYAVQMVRDGTEALSMVLPNPPDLIILDLLLPKIDGFEVLRNLKSNRLTASIPVIILTARATAACRNKSYTLGASRFFAKPFSPRKLVAEMETLLSESPGRMEMRGNSRATRLRTRHWSAEGESTNPSCQENLLTQLAESHS